MTNSTNVQESHMLSDLGETLDLSVKRLRAAVQRGDSIAYMFALNTIKQQVLGAEQWLGGFEPRVTIHPQPLNGFIESDKEVYSATS